MVGCWSVLMRKAVRWILLLFGLWQFGDYMYWTDWQTEKIERASKHNGSGRTLIQSRLEGLMDIHLVSPLRQTGKENKLWPAFWTVEFLFFCKCLWCLYSLWFYLLQLRKKVNIKKIRSLCFVYVLHFSGLRCLHFFFHSGNEDS